MDFVALLSFGIVIGLVFALILAWPAMILFGVVHSFLFFIPAFSYGQTLAIMLLLRLIIPTSTSASTS
jgi:hypothetical protein